MEHQGKFVDLYLFTSSKISQNPSVNFSNVRPCLRWPLIWPSEFSPRRRKIVQWRTTGDDEPDSTVDNHGSFASWNMEVSQKSGTAKSSMLMDAFPLYKVLKHIKSHPAIRVPPWPRKPPSVEPVASKKNMIFTGLLFLFFLQCGLGCNWCQVFRKKPCMITPTKATSKVRILCNER